MQASSVLRTKGLMSSCSSTPFITAGELYANLQKYKILDTTWFMPNDPRDPLQEFHRSHLPRARFFPLEEVSDSRSRFPHMMPTAAHFRRAMGDLGIKRTDEVLLYEVGPMFSVARVWFTFRLFRHAGPVRILKGGLKAWRDQSLPVYGTDHPSPPPTLAEEAGKGQSSMREEERVEYSEAEPECRHDLLVDFPQLRSILRDDDSAHSASTKVEEEETRQQSIILDARPAARFHGTAAEPRPGLPSGHMPNSLSLPFSELLQRDGTLLPPKEVEGVLARVTQRSIESLRRDSVRVLVTCGTGVTACIVALALDSIGIQARLYDESWTGYADPSRAGNLENMIVKTAT